jgi:hypothetical protein
MSDDVSLDQAAQIIADARVPSLKLAISPSLPKSCETILAL